jgi:cytosolic carboxypeptidase protein 2/3
MQGIKTIYMYEDPLPLAVPLPKRGYSLEADMLLGWRPKFIKTPILLYYNDDLYIDLYKKFYPVVYQGYRPKDSFAFHQELIDGSQNSYPFDFADKSLTAYNFINKNKTQSQDFAGMTKEAPGNSLIFDSKFESGNLDQVVMISSYEYDLYMRPDTNTGTHMHWFYFSVTGFAGTQTVKFNIVNFSRSSPLFKAGMKPKALSLIKLQQGETCGWEYIGENLTFGVSKINKLLDPGCKKQFFMLSFEFQPVSPNDKIWIATTTPYTFSRLWKVIKYVKSDDINYHLSHIKVSNIGKTLSLVDIPMITITNPYSKLKKKVIVAIGRVHPSETVGSWVMEGFFRYVASRNQEARKLREKFIFKIIPMCNPDGVIIGNSRTGLSGYDLNRCYLNPSSKLQPEAKIIKQMVEKLIENGLKIYMFLDFHGHFCKKGSFMYGPSYPLHDINYFQTRIIPKLLSERTSIFRYHSSRFIVEKSKKSTARMVMWKELGITNAYTLETSYFGYLKHDRETQVFSIEDFYILAEKLARTIYEYHIIQKQEKKKQKQKAKERNLKKQRPYIKSREDQTLEPVSRGDPASNESSLDSIPLESGFQTVTSFTKVPDETIIPLNVAKEDHIERNLEDVIQVKYKQMIKLDCNDTEESESQGSGSESDEPKETIELPPLEKTKNILSNQPTITEKKTKRKLILNEKFAKRLQQIREKRKKDLKAERKNNFPSIIASVSTNRKLKSISEKEIP